MNQKKAGWLFFIVIIVYEGASLLTGRISRQYPLDFRLVLFLGEAFMLIPALLLLGLFRANPVRLCRFRKIKVSTALMTVLFSFMAMPAATLMNILSMFFLDNTVSLMSGEIIQTGFLISFLAIAVYGPVAEEVVFRGILFGGYRESASAWKAILISALLFGMMHMNFNQMGYAFVLGIGMALLVEVTGSIWSSIIFHITVNARSVVMLFLADGMGKWAQGVTNGMELSEELLENAGATVTNSQLGAMLCLELLIAVVCLPIAGCILAWIAKREGGLDKLKSLWSERKTGRVFSIPVILAIIICVGIMVKDML